MICNYCNRNLERLIDSVKQHHTKKQLLMKGILHPQGRLVGGPLLHEMRRDGSDEYPDDRYQCRPGEDELEWGG